MAKIRACLATSGVVEQGGSKVRITREAIESLPEQITRGQAIPVGIDHDPFCLPIGKIEEVWVEPLGEELAVMARIHLEDAPSVATHRRSGVEFVHLDFEDSPEPFRARRYGNAGQRGNTLTVDMANFANPQDYTAFANDVSAIDDTITCDDAIQRHSFGPEPFLQFVISNPEISAAMAVGVWVIGRIEKFVRYTVDETLSKVADDIADTLSAKIKRILRAYDSRRSEDDRASVTQIAISSDPELILLVKSERGEEFPPLDLNNLAAEIERFGDILKEASSAVFAHEGTNGWVLQYLTTRSGKVLGTLECYGRTNEVARRMKTDLDSESEDIPSGD